MADFVHLALLMAAILALSPPAAPPAMSGRDRPAFPPDPLAAEAREKMLERVQVGSPSRKRPPNVVLILVDDLGYADTGIYGSKTIPTPHIDTLARSGVLMTDAYAAAAACSPSRAGLLTGRYPQRSGFEFNTGGGPMAHKLHRGLDPREVTLADLLKRASYATGAFGKWHLGTQPHMHPLSRGFDVFYGFLVGQHDYFPTGTEKRSYMSILRGRTPAKESEYLTDAITREALRFIADHRHEPFFAYVAYNAVHEPFEAPAGDLARFPETENPEVRAYRAMVGALDDAVGSLAAALDEHGLTERTLVIFMNDNGARSYAEVPSDPGVQSNAPLRMGKMWLYEGGVRVPMIMRWPGVVKPGTVFRGVTSALDVLPTVAAAAGLRLPTELELDGIDMAPFLTGQVESAPRRTLFWSRDDHLALRRGDWKLVRIGDRRRLFDLSKDIGEMNDLAGERPELVEELNNELERWRAEMKPAAWPAP